MRFLLLVLVGCVGEAPPEPPPDAAGIALDCATACRATMSSCTGANAQYASPEECMASCSHFPIGTMADTSGNSLGCRIHHALAAEAAPDVHCLHAGPSGGGHCGYPCDGFCSIVVAACPAQYPSMGDCWSACTAFSPGPLYASGVTSGNTLSCRLAHATMAALDPATHCPHTAPASPTCM